MSISIGKVSVNLGEARIWWGGEITEDNNHLAQVELIKQYIRVRRIRIEGLWSLESTIYRLEKVKNLTAYYYVGAINIKVSLMDGMNKNLKENEQCMREEG